MLTNFFATGFLDRYPDYELHPCNFNLRPDKLHSIQLGQRVSPEGWNCGGYLLNGNSYAEWMSLCWIVEKTPDRGIAFWLRFLALEGEFGKKGEKNYTEFPAPRADAFSVEIVDGSGHNAGYGPEWKTKVLNTIDDVFLFIKETPRLRAFFFTEQEVKNLKLNHYVTR